MVECMIKEREINRPIPVEMWGISWRYSCRPNNYFLIAWLNVSNCSCRTEM